ncbi:MAG: 3-hydroxyacyl-ACP dehydratase FabZ [Proteobacteria bacterium]|nr:3-hydroxyacyl-ACP dehydratase FabZ [Pseudomonadota bacterium]
MHDFGGAHMATLDVQQIKALIPHRYPLLMIDRIEEVQLDHSAVGIKNVSYNEWYFQGHFPSKAVFPGVLIIEAMAQTAAVLVQLTRKQQGTFCENNLVYFMSVEEAKFRKPVYPGDVLKLKVFKEKSRGNVWKFRSEAWVGETMTDEAQFTAMIAESE